MFVCRSFPRLEDILVEGEYRRYFYSRWGHENCIVSDRTKRAEYPPFMQRLSIKTARGGRERYHIDSRTVAVDDDNYLIINDQRTYASTLRSDEPVHSFSVFFRPGFAEETLGALRLSAERALEAGGEAPSHSTEFAEQLHAHDRVVTPLLRYISDQVDAGNDDALWYEEQLSFLMERMLRVQREKAVAVGSLSMERAATRREVYRRIGWSTDYIHTYYMRPLAIADLARSASLSLYHYMRLFRALLGVTPFAYLQRKRASVAARLLRSTDLSQEEVAIRVGFESRSTMFRHLRRHAGSGVRGLRRTASAS
jgi:AraC family transcriptional regulator